MSTTEDRAEDQARAQVRSISEMVAAREVDYDRLQELRDERDTLSEEDYRNWPDSGELAELEAAAGDCKDADEARERIEQDALSVEVRSGWQSPGEAGMGPEEFRIVLCTGGPHVELVGELDEHCEPSSVRVLYREWGTSGELFDFDRDTVLTYCRCFYFGS